MTNVMVINPNFHGSSYLYPEGERKFYRIWENLPLEYCVSVLMKNGFNTKYIDAHASNLSVEKIIGAVNSFKPDYCVISSTDYDRFCCPQFETNELDNIANEIKKVSKNIIIIAVGPHGTYWPNKLLENKNIDFITRREFDYTVYELIVALEKKYDFNKVKGIGFKDNGKVICTPYREFIKNLDSLPFPYRENMQRYFDSSRSALFDFGIDKELRPMALLIGSRGCPMRCVFCLQKSFFGKQYRMRSPKNIVNEIETLVNRYKVKFIWFLDEMLTFDKKRCMELCNLIIERRIDVQWCCDSRVDRIDDEMLKKMKGAGCQSIMYGVESCYQPVLDALKKDIKREQIKNAITLTEKNGIVAKLFLLFGSPQETNKSMKKTIEFIEETKPKIAVFHEVIPYPTTELFEIAKQERKVKDDYDWDGICKATGKVGNKFNSDDIKKLGKELRRKFLFYNLKQLFGKYFYINPKFIFWFLKSFRFKDFKNYFDI